MSWGGFQYVPGQEVTLKGGLGSGRIMAGLYGGATHRLYRVQRRDGGSIEVAESSIASAGPVPDYDVGQRVRVRWHGVGTVVGKVERTDAPGYLYTVEITSDSRFVHEGQPTTTVGAEHIMGAA